MRSLLQEVKYWDAEIQSRVDLWREELQVRWIMADAAAKQAILLGSIGLLAALLEHKLVRKR